MGKQWKQCQTLFWGAPKSLQMVTAAMKLKDAYSLVLGSFNGPEPGGPESTIRKWQRELEGGRERERKKERKTWGPKLWWSKGILLAEMQAYISLVRWLFSYYTGWNFINSHNMDSLIHTRSLTLKRVTEGSYWKESKEIPFLMISVLRAVCSSTHSQNRNW